MKMGFLLKNNARKRMGEKGALKKGEGKEAEKRPPKFANSKTDGRLGGNSQILKAGNSSAIGASSTPRKGRSSYPGHRPG